MKAMTITLAEDAGQKCRVRMTGSITLRTFPGIRQELLQWFGTHREMEVDLSDVAVVDTEGVRAFLTLRNEAARDDRVLRFVSRSEAFLKLLDVMNRAFFGVALAG